MERSFRWDLKTQGLAYSSLSRPWLLSLFLSASSNLAWVSLLPLPGHVTMGKSLTCSEGPDQVQICVGIHHYLMDSAGAIQVALTLWLHMGAGEGS